MNQICFKCNQPVGKGNLRPASEVAVKCSACVQSEVEYVANHPKEFPDAHKTMDQINRELKQDAVRRRRARRNS